MRQCGFLSLLLSFLFCSIISLIYLAPQFGLINGSDSNRTSTLSPFVSDLERKLREQSNELKLKNQEVTKLEERMKAMEAKLAMQGQGQSALSPSSTSSSAVPKDSSVTIDVMNLLGHQQFFSGISWDPFLCPPPYKNVWPKIDNQTVKKLSDKMKIDLRNEMAKIKGIKPEEVKTGKPFYEAGLVPDPLSSVKSDPLMTKWRSRILPVLSKYLVTGLKEMAAKCDKVVGKIVIPEDLGTSEVDCSLEWDDKKMAEALGYYAIPFDSIDVIVDNYVTVGMCSSQVRNHRDSYAHWLRTERINNKNWSTFLRGRVENLDQDAIILLFDMLYERLAAFTGQYWLGVITMQNPFDVYSIQDIIFTTRPTLLIETGTANGGSALLWASIMELCEIEGGRVVTMDMNAPKWEEGGKTWGGLAREDPTKHKIWKKRVTFHHGSTVDKGWVEKAKAMTLEPVAGGGGGGQKVMVLLDSHHSEVHVFAEMEYYCPMVSVGCYCIVEDTKMSRWSSDGPMEAVKRFVVTHPEFVIDRSREHLYSHHTSGYLRRIK